MRLLDLPPNPDAMFDACTAGIDDIGLLARFTAARSTVLEKFSEYARRGDCHSLFTLPASAWGQSQKQVLPGITKDDFVNLYSKYLVGDERPGRAFYDRLKMRAPLGLCPLCGFGEVSKLDHFLPKSRYPVFSVLNANLIPTCTDCNTEKGSSLVTEEDQMLHPYFEPVIVQMDVWLFATITRSTPATVRYFVDPPDYWGADLSRRLENYFRDLGLARRFGVQAASEIVSAADLLATIATADERKSHVNRVAQVEREKRPNSWKSALYEAMSESDWFLNEGFKYSCSTT